MAESDWSVSDLFIISVPLVLKRDTPTGSRTTVPRTTQSRTTQPRTTQSRTTFPRTERSQTGGGENRVRLMSFDICNGYLYHGEVRLGHSETLASWVR